MTCERTLIFARSTLWIAPQNLPIYVMELTVMGGVPIKKGGDKIQSFSMSCDLPMIKGTPPGVSSLGSVARNLD